MSGPVLILGCPGSGKTTRALDMAASLISSTGAVLVVIDTGRVELFDRMYHASTLAELAARVWGEGLHTAYTPSSPADFELLCGMIYDAAEANRAKRKPVVPVAFLTDELYNVRSAFRKDESAAQRILREHRRVLAGAYITSQLYRDGGRVIKGLISELVVYRMTAPEDQADLRADYGLNADELAALPSAKQCAESKRPISDAYRILKVGF